MEKENKKRFESFYISDIKSSDISKEESDKISLEQGLEGMNNLAKKIDGEFSKENK